jgi:hypothetical protein
MYCPNCGKSIPDGSAFCPGCGKPATGAPAQKKTANPLGVLWKIFVAVVVVCGALFLFAYISVNTKKNALDSGGVMKAVLGVPAPVTEKVLSGNISIGPGQYQFKTFTIYPEMTKAELSGSFHASGGSGNDIQAVVATSSEFENWINGHQARVYYSAQKVTNGQMDVHLAPGTYVIAFSNKFSLLAEKEVTAEITLHYWRPYESEPRMSVQPPAPDSPQ